MPPASEPGRADQRPTLAEPEAVRDELGEEDQAAARAEPNRGQSSLRGQDASAADEPVGVKRGTIAYLPVEVKERLEGAARGAGQSYTEWFLDQFDALYDQLAEEYPPPPQRRSPLPPRPRPSRRRTGIGASTMVQLRFTDAERAALDERRAQLGGPSRSEFVTRIIELATAPR